MQTDCSKTDPDYHIREMRTAQAQADAKRKDQSPDDAARLLDALTVNLDHFAQSVEWLIAGNYGYAQQWEAWQILNAKRMNKPAALCQIVALLEYGVKEEKTRKVWRGLTDAQQFAVAKAMQRVIDSALADRD